MKLLDKKTASDATKLVIFMVVTILATGMLVVLIGNITFSQEDRVQGGVRRRHRCHQG